MQEKEKRKILVLGIASLFIALTMIPVGMGHSSGKVTEQSCSEAEELSVLENGGYDWNKTFGGSMMDRGYSVRQMQDGGYIIVGDTSSFTGSWVNSDVWLIKTDSRGKMEWNKTFGGIHSDRGFSVQPTLDGGCIIIGEKGFDEPKFDDIWLIKTDSSGNEEWNKTFGGNGRDIGFSVQQTSEGGYIILGFRASHGAWLIKTDSNGNKEWDKTYGGFGYSVQQTSDGGYIFTGEIVKRIIPWFGITDVDIWVVKTNSQGEKQWAKSFGDNDYNQGQSIQQTLDGGYIVAGDTVAVRSSSGDCNDLAGIWLIKIDSNGNEEWIRKFGGGGHDYAQSVQQTSDGGFVIVGEVNSFGVGYGDVWLIKVSPLYIAKPKGGHLYITNREIMPIGLNTAIIGKITVEVNSYGDISIFNKVEFYVDDVLKCKDTVQPFEWVWDETIFGRHTLKVVAYDDAGNSASNEITALIFNIS